MLGKPYRHLIDNQCTKAPQAPSAEQEHMKRSIVHLSWILVCLVAIAYPARAQDAPSDTPSLTSPDTPVTSAWALRIVGMEIGLETYAVIHSTAWFPPSGGSPTAAVTMRLR